MRLIGRVCKGSNALSLPVLICRGLDLNFQGLRCKDLDFNSLIDCYLEIDVFEKECSSDKEDGIYK